MSKSRNANRFEVEAINPEGDGDSGGVNGGTGGTGGTSGVSDNTIWDCTGISGEERRHLMDTDEREELREDERA